MSSHNSVNLLLLLREIEGVPLQQKINPYLIWLLQAYIILSAKKFLFLAADINGFVLLLPVCKIFRRIFKDLEET